ncbi:MAG TPA: ankyrin repeat domain-containing protein [Longimicrobiales bacterium]|nr:ankyrin repeat domain-containing protein [Longimicrobiales bacterium]
MSTTTEALEPELERPVPPDAPLRFEYDTRRTLLVVRSVAAILALPFIAALIMRSTGVFAVVALLLAAASAWLLVIAQRRLVPRPGCVTVAADGLSLGGTMLRWSDIVVVSQTMLHGGIAFGTRTNPTAVTVHADLAGYTGFAAATIERIAAARTSDEPPRHTARADSLFQRRRAEDLITGSASLAGVVLGLAVGPGYFALTAMALPRLVWHWLSAPSTIAVDDTAVWIIRPLARDAVPLRAIEDVGLAMAGRIASLVVVLEHRGRGAIPISGLGANALPLFDAVTAARMRARLAARTGPAAVRSGSAIRLADSRKRMLQRAGTVALLFVAVAWLTVLTGVPLRTAARLGNTGIARAAIVLGSPLGLQGRDGMTALHHTANGNHADIARALLSDGADADAPSERDALTPLHVAAARGHTEVVEVLIAGGANVNVRSAAGRTPLAHAALADASGDGEAAARLVQAGADVAIADADGRTVLHHAALNGHASLIRSVIAAATADEDAIDFGNVAAAIEAGDTAGSRPLHAAVLAKQQDAVAALVAAGADVNARGRGGRTPLAAAAAAGAPAAIASMLLDAGAGAALADDDGWNAVQIAVRENSVPLLELFARSRAPLNATSGRIAPALWLAADAGNTAAARALLRGGASPYVRWNGRRAIDVARANRNAALLALMQMR